MKPSLFQRKDITRAILVKRSRIFWEVALDNNIPGYSIIEP